MKAIAMKPGWNELLPCELSDAELIACLDEAARRGASVSHAEVEMAYEALLEGRSGLASVLLSRALFPAGADSVKARVEAHRKQAMRRGSNRKTA